MYFAYWYLVEFKFVQYDTDVVNRRWKKCSYVVQINVHFTFNEEVYKQTDGVAMGSLLGPVIADIFMVELENNIVPVLQEIWVFGNDMLMILYVS